MNDRIQELAIDCANQLNWDFPSDPKEYTFSPDGLEKFAESIIQECMSQIALIGISNSENEDISWACHKAVENIKDHFGINSNQCNRKNCDKGTDGYCARCHAESYPFM
jgi:hypothetical protein